MFRLSCDRSRDYIFGRKNVYLRVAWDDDPTWCSSNCGKRYITATDKLGVSAAPDTTFNLIPVRDGVKIQVNACGAANGPTQYRDGDPIDPVCLLEQHEFDGYDVHVGWNITSLEACARACLPYVGCEFVTWVPSRNECHFKSSDENARFNSTFSSVRMSCLSDPTAVADLELDVKPECYQEGDIMGNDILSVKNVESAEYCVKRGYLYKDYGCKAVTYKTDEKICYLKAISNNPHPNSGAISLPLDCITDATIKTKYCKPGTYVSSTGTLGKEADAAIFAQIDAGLLTYFREASTGLYFFFSNTPDDPSILKGSSGPTKMFEIL
ncbi:MAG: hypothetical protein KVP17_002311 [Porospora cf. gigantea B]|nr:MAG: hypothetical protein KVP17_002311 [Porospora cf. gigantea B]